MANSQREAVNQDLHPQAQALIKELVGDFSTSLILRAKIISFERRADVVITNHVREAHESLRPADYRRSWGGQLMTVVGGAMFGAFIPGFISGLGGGSTTMLSIFTVVGFAGMFLVFVGLRR